ncbi:MAG: PD-(D/E)XK nuclease family protein, partial [Actinomycetes bacterium]
AGLRAGHLARQPRPSDALLREALLQPESLVTLDPDVAGPVRRLGELLHRTREVVQGGGTAEEALWVLWDGTPWPRRLARVSYAGGRTGRAADRDLDAVCALFDAAARAEERRGHLGVRSFLSEIRAQQVVADPGRVDDLRGGAVRVLTAHRSKGLEWDVVFTVGVQEGVWPDMRRRGSLLEADRIGPEGPQEPPTPAAMLAEERRLFYVAVTRARQRLVVTAVDSPEDDGQRPSRFLDELDVEVVPVRHRPRRPLSVPGLVAELRATAVDVSASPALRQAATRRLARLATARDETGRLLVPSADPSRWWGLVEQTDPEVPMHDPGRPVRLSGSALDGLTGCPLRWFLQREVHAESARTVALGFGSVVHVLADEVARGTTPPRLDALVERLDRVWDRLAFEAPWQSTQQRDEARSALERFLVWHVAERGRVAVATEHEFEVSLAVGETEVRLRGSMDRVEVDAEGRVHVVDFKTGKTVPPTSALVEHPQLGAYQLAVREGALHDVPGVGYSGHEPGGAELVQLRKDVRGYPQVQRQGALTPDEDGTSWVDRLVADAVGRVLAEDFPPVVSEVCERCEFRRCCSARSEGRQVVE